MKAKQAPLVSVIICFLNEEKFLSEAIQGVINQEFTDWELLLVDDGSTDGSVTLAKAFAQQFPEKIHYVEHEGHANIGLSASRNVGIKKAQADLVALLDADDVWFPNKLAQQVAIMQKHQDVTLLCEASEYWFDWEDPAKANVLEPVGSLLQDCVYNPPQLIFELYPLAKGAAPCPSALVMRKSLLKNQFFEDSFLGMYEDQVFLTKMYLNEKIYISSACTNLYRVREDSMMNTVEKDGSYKKYRMRYLNWLQTYLDEQNITDKRIRKCLRDAQLPYRSQWLHRIINKLSFR